MKKLGVILLATVISCAAVIAILALIGVTLNLITGDGAGYRETAKHVPLSRVSPVEVTVDSILKWPIPPTPGRTSPRTGRELKLFHISKAYLQNVWFNGGDGDLHFEIAQTQDKSAPRVIVETPVGESYKESRKQIVDALTKRGIAFRRVAEVPGNQTDIEPVEVEVLGLAFFDEPHYRGSKTVATCWELHPAVVSIH